MIVAANDNQHPFRKFWSGSCHAHWRESNALHSMGMACVFKLEAAQSFEFKADTKTVQSVASTFNNIMVSYISYM